LLLPPFAFFVAKKAENARSAVKLDGLCHENGRKRDKDRHRPLLPLRLGKQNAVECPFCAEAAHPAKPGSPVAEVP
jgi:hypothetical protein